MIGSIKELKIVGEFEDRLDAIHVLVKSKASELPIGIYEMISSGHKQRSMEKQCAAYKNRTDINEFYLRRGDALLKKLTQMTESMKAENKASKAALAALRGQQ